MPEYRVEELAAQAGISVDLVRSYQWKGLLPPPRHQGRSAFYGPRHLDRLRVIRELKEEGHSLRIIATMVAGDGGSRRRARPAGSGGEDDRLNLAELAERARVPPGLLRSLEASGLLRPLNIDDDRRYTTGDVRAVRMVLSLVGAGVPMDEFMDVARTQIDAASSVAEGAVELFLRYVRQPLVDAGLAPAEEADQLVTAFRLMLHAATELVAYNIQRMMLNLVEGEIERLGTGAEQDAFRREVTRRRLEVVFRG
ncbi:MAG TPA: MerR family transcriptional regulator [Acidimicrobiales bacterium]|nr:MerR family transcriptional regulator [Acidimicrobiales bacterium]